MGFLGRLTLALEDKRSDLFVDLWGTAVANQFVEMMQAQGVDNHQFFVVDAKRELGCYCIGKIYLNRRLMQRPALAGTVMLYELGKAHQFNTVGDLFMFWLGKDLDGNDISFEKALSIVTKAEHKAAKFCNEMIDRYNFPFDKLPHNATEPDNERWLRVGMQHGWKNTEELQQYYLSQM